MIDGNSFLNYFISSAIGLVAAGWGWILAHAHGRISKLERDAAQRKSVDDLASLVETHRIENNSAHAQFVEKISELSKDISTANVTLARIETKGLRR